MIIMDSEIYFMDFYCKMMNPVVAYCIFDNVVLSFYYHGTGQYRVFSALGTEMSGDEPEMYLAKNMTDFWDNSQTMPIFVSQFF